MSKPIISRPTVRPAILRGASAPTRPPGYPRINLGPVGRCPVTGTLIIALFDDSYSMRSPGADPASNRYKEAEFAFDTVSQACRCGNELGAVVHFDAPTTGDIGPVKLTGRTSARLKKGLREPRDADGTSSMGPSLEVAFEIAGRHSDLRPSLVVFTDLELLDDDPQAVLDRLAQFPGRVHVVGLNSHIPDGLLDDRITVTQVGSNDPIGAVARALFSSLTADR